MTYDCSERKSIEIKSLKQFDEMKKFFSMQIKQKVFKEVDVDEPYYVWKNKSNNSVMYYADKWYKCEVCNTLWELKYPEFPAYGFVKKYIDGIYAGKEIRQSII